MESITDWSRRSGRSGFQLQAESTLSLITSMAHNLHLPRDADADAVEAGRQETFAAAAAASLI